MERPRLLSKILGEAEGLLRQARCKYWRQSLKKAVHSLDPSIDSILSSIPSLSEEEFTLRFMAKARGWKVLTSCADFVTTTMGVDEVVDYMVESVPGWVKTDRGGRWLSRLVEMVTVFVTTNTRCLQVRVIWCTQSLLNGSAKVIEDNWLGLLLVGCTTYAYIPLPKA